jgi:hypothetical protein
MTAVREFRTRRPTGRPPMPLVLLAGGEKTGKSYAAAALSATDFVDRTFWIELGEGAADQYGEIPNTRYEIVVHDGTHSDIVAAIEWIIRQPRENKPHAIVIDSMTELWDLLTEEAQATANRRAAAKAAKSNRGAPTDDVQITMDLWNAAKKRWRRVVDLLRTYDGPVILTARLELVTVMGENGAPTTAKDWKIRAEKNLPFECDVIVRMPAPGVAELTGIRSLRLQVPAGGVLPMPEFTLEKLLTQMGLAAEGATAPRSYTAPTPEALDVEPERVAQRERVQSDDEWQAPAVAMADQRQVNDLAEGLRVVRKAESPEVRRGALSQILGREVAENEQLTRADAERALSALREEDRQNTAGRTQNAPNAPAKPQPATGAQLTLLNTLTTGRGLSDRNARLTFLSGFVKRPLVSSKDLTKDEATAIIDRLKSEPAPESVPVREQLSRRIRAAVGSEELAVVSEDVWSAKEAGQIDDVQASALIDLSMERENELSVAVSA